MTATTITTYHEIIADYVDWFQKKTPILFEPMVQLQALDIYLMRQIVDYLPEAPHVIDMGSEASFGISRLMWLHQYNLSQFTTIGLSPSTPQPQWHRLLNQYIEKRKYTDHAIINEIEAIENSSSHVQSDTIVCLIVGDVDSQISAIQTIYAVYSDAILFILPLLKLHHEGTLQLVKSIETLDRPYRLTALREWSPFFSDSELGIIYAQDHDVIEPVLTRLAQLYKGNHDFLPLIKLQIDSQVESMSQAIIQLDQRLNQQKDQQMMTAQTPIPNPSASGRFFQRLFGQNPSIDRVPTFRTSQQLLIKTVRNSYHQVVPLKVRLSVRDLRVRILGF